MISYIKTQVTCYRDYVIPLQNKPHLLDDIITKTTHFMKNPPLITERYEWLLKALCINKFYNNLLSKSLTYAVTFFRL